MRVAIVAEDLWPLSASSEARHATALAKALAPEAEVTILTRAEVTARFDRKARSRWLEGVDLVGLATSSGLDSGFLSPEHEFSASVHAELASRWPDGGPDLVEFADLGGAGAVCAQARQVADRTVERATVCVRAQGSLELRRVFNGAMPRDFDSRVVHELERCALRFADRLLIGNETTASVYRRHYRSDELAALATVPASYRPPEGEPDATDTTRGEEGPLRLLYLGALERRLGVDWLVHAVASVESELELTLAGADTATAPLGHSMREYLELMTCSDPRIRFVDGPDPEAELGLVRAHDVLVAPARFVAAAPEAVVALGAGRPVLAMPVGGLLDILGPASGEGRHVGGWRVPGTSRSSLTCAIEGLAACPERARAPWDHAALRERALELSDPQLVRRAYRELAGVRRPAAHRPFRRAPALVSIVIPYYKMERYVEEAVASAFGQTHPHIEVVLVNDGSLREPDAVVDRLAERYPLQVVTQANSGLGSARNLGISQARGDYVVPLDADNLLEPEFAAECVEALERAPSLAYVTCWSQFVSESGEPVAEGARGLRPLGNATSLVHDVNVAGDALATIRRSVFARGHCYSVELTSFEDWLFYRQLNDAGLVGGVIPRRLCRYRVRAQSMSRSVGHPNLARLVDELDAHVVERRLLGIE